MEECWPYNSGAWGSILGSASGNFLLANPVHCAVLGEHLVAARRLPSHSGSLWGQKQLFKRDAEANRLQLEDMGN